jgi:hypothetical protein
LTIHEHVISNQGFLETRTHKVISRTRIDEDAEVDPEEGKIDDEGNKNKAKGTRGKMLPEVLLLRA